jgi:hypothetical protein
MIVTPTSHSSGAGRRTYSTRLRNFVFSPLRTGTDIPAMGIVAEIREVNAFTSLHTYFTAEKNTFSPCGRSQRKSCQMAYLFPQRAGKVA